MSPGRTPIASPVRRSFRAARRCLPAPPTYFSPPSAPTFHVLKKRVALAQTLASAGAEPSSSSSALSSSSSSAMSTSSFYSVSSSLSCSSSSFSSSSSLQSSLASILSSSSQLSTSSSPPPKRARWPCHACDNAGNTGKHRNTGTHNGDVNSYSAISKKLPNPLPFAAGAASLIYNLLSPVGVVGDAALRGLARIGSATPRSAAQQHSHSHSHSPSLAGFSALTLNSPNAAAGTEGSYCQPRGDAYGGGAGWGCWEETTTTTATAKEMGQGQTGQGQGLGLGQTGQGQTGQGQGLGLGQTGQGQTGQGQLPADWAGLECGEARPRAAGGRGAEGEGRVAGLEPPAVLSPKAASMCQALIALFSP
jgi:hypothetical protein